MTTHGLPLEPDTEAPDDLWRSKYRSERTKARLLGATTVAASLLAVGLGAWGLNAQGATVASGPGQFGGLNAGQAAPPGVTGGQQGGLARPPGGGPMGQDLASVLLNSDGSVNTEAVAEFTAQMPDAALEQLLGFAVVNGELTQEQADSIAAAAAATATSEDT